MIFLQRSYEGDVLPEHLAVSDFDLNITPAAIDRFNMIINDNHLIRVYKSDDTFTL